MELSVNTELEPGRVYEALVICASNIMVDGRGATIQGVPAAAHLRNGSGVSGVGVNNVTVRNLRVAGFGLGLKVSDGEGWSIEGCDFSDNLHDPGFGWGDHASGGGVLFERVRHSTVRNNVASRVWNGCELIDSHDCTIEGNDFSNTSNTCLKLWAACRNTVLGNNLSYGIRIDPGEVHARDSCGLLVEHGSDDNRFENNDVQHGGDGIFVRVLDGQPSRGNLFRGNDASYANNNCIESAAPDNTYLENRANHGSYGFWMGCSDGTVLIGNEAGWNGLPTGQHNAPEPGFGHGGIVFVNGSAQRILAARNFCHHNAGGGIVLRGDISGQGAYRASRWIIQNNRLEANRWGIYLRKADSIFLGPNDFQDNLDKDVFNDGDVSDLRIEDEALPEEEWLKGL